MLTFALRAGLMLALGATALSAQALELRLLSAGAVEPGVRPVVAAFEQASGHAVRIEFAAAPALRAAVRATAPGADIVVVTQGIFDELVATGVATASAAVPLGRVGVGVAVRPGVAAPDLASGETLKAALLGADSVVFNRASTGLYVEHMLRQLGIADAVNAKAERLADGASVMRRLLAGSAAREFGFGALTEIALFRGQGLVLVGPLPATLQNYTTYVALPWPGATPGDPARAAAVTAVMQHLRSAAARAQLASAGIDPVPP